MVPLDNIQVAIVDYGFGNLFSVRQACETVGLAANITSSAKKLIDADAVILPGVGAFGDAMDSLNRLDLVSPLRDVAASRKPLIGICLGMQLLLTESFEFGHHQGLNLIRGQVLSLAERISEIRRSDGRPETHLSIKIPHVGWNRIHKCLANDTHLSQESIIVDSWKGSHLEGIEDGSYMYFIHSYYVEPDQKGVTNSWSSCGELEFCSSVRLDNIQAYQFHPERSGLNGIQIYRNLANLCLSEKTSNA